jgi:hypothetical protein
MVRLPTIHVIHKDWKLPFDVAAFRAVYFSRIDYADLETARASLKSTVEEVMRPGFVVENPITHARGAINLDQHASPEQRVLLNRLEALEHHVQELGRSNTLRVTGLRALDAALAARGETFEEFVNRRLAEKNLTVEETEYWVREMADRRHERFSSVKQSNE